MPHRSRFALGALTAAEIALPPESDCAGPGFLVVPVAARAGADAHQLVTVRATRASCIAGLLLRRLARTRARLVTMPTAGAIGAN